MHSEQEKDEEKGMPTIVMKDDKTMVMAKVVPNKGVQEYAVEVTRRFMEQLEYSKAIMKSDNAPAILGLKEAVRREASMEIVMEEAPVGDHQANGAAKNAVKNVQGQFRVLKDALESRIKKRIEGDRQIVPSVDGDARGAGDQQGSEG